MKRSEKTKRIQEILDNLYPDPPIPLDHSDAFTLLIAVLLSAQTTDAQVNRVTPALFQRASTAEAMAKLDVTEIHVCIRSCGLAPSKAQNISKLARILATEYGGRVPDDETLLETLPGVGHKTASVVLAQAFRRNAFPVDTHIHRLAWRWGLSNGRSVSQTERDLKKAFPEESWNRLHLQMIYFGREYCPALRHRAADCPICSWAMSRRRMRSEARITRGHAPGARS